MTAEARSQQDAAQDAFSERLVEAVRRYYALVDANDIEGTLALFSEDAVYHRPGYEPLVGRGQIERFFREQRVIEQGVHTVVDVVASGVAVAVHGQCSAQLKDGRHVELRFADFFVADQSGSFRKRDTFFFTPLV